VWVVGVMIQSLCALLLYSTPSCSYPLVYSLCVVQVESFVQGQLSLYSLGRLQLPQTPFVTDSTTCSKSRRVQGSPFSEQ
jgi:hypothetical protein